MIKIQNLYDERTNTLTYVVHDPHSLDAVIIDPVLDFDPANGLVWQESIGLLIEYIQANNLKPLWILETHAHADHLSSAHFLKVKFPHLKLGISEHITEVQKTFKNLFNISHIKEDGSAFDRLFKDMDILKAGTLSIQVRQTPGHTPACVSYIIEDAIFTGDAIFMPDSGTGRCDFPSGSAELLFSSIQEKIYSLPDQTRIFVGHDYQPNGRSLKFETTVGEQKENNIQLKKNTTKNEYVEFRTKRDKTLATPKLLIPSIQVNIDAGKLPPQDSNGMSYLKIPIKLKV
jgi:glyoxylase-like metal-dependent hydrolase (beta-lactamase superfamily II)